jgi:hypothetical protein
MDQRSDFSLWVEELRAALAAEWAEPLPCSGLQAFNRSRRVTLARMAVMSYMNKASA